MGNSLGLKSVREISQLKIIIMKENPLFNYRKEKLGRKHEE